MRCNRLLPVTFEPLAPPYGADRAPGVTRRVERFEFRESEPEPVLRQMDAMVAQGDGWVNLLPGIAEDSVQDDEPVGLFSFLGSSRPAVTMLTWMSPRNAGRRQQLATVGIMHALGVRAVPTLNAHGVPVPVGWSVTQDNVRRGLVARVPADAPCAAVLGWALSAGSTLCAADLTGSWLCEAHLPQV
jgi:hypothetical protein